MSKKALNLEMGSFIYDDLLCHPEKLPVSFMYKGISYHGLGQAKEISADITPDHADYLYALDDTIQVRVKAKYCEAYGQSEYTVWFENNGTAPSALLRDVYAVDCEFPGAAPVLRSCMGDHENRYAAYQNDLTQASSYFHEDNGRATHIVFPYFDLVHGDGGTMIALGWAGTWDALFAYVEDTGKTKLRARTCKSLCGVLMPGEKVRTGLVVLLPYSGRDYDNASNLWREWFMNCNLPRANAAGDPILPISTSNWSNDTGRPNSDGSISEAYDTWQPTLEKLLQENMIPDFRWFDAGWYSDPYGNTVETDWWGTIGSWEPDPVKWPGATLRESFDACHRHGMKVLVWFEPERVTNVDALVENYGYKKEWGLVNGRIITNNLGDEECRRWTLDRIIKMMDENNVDMYREDNNSDPAFSWNYLDGKDEARLGVPRKGINENKCICGHYALWDDILDFCRRTGRCTFVDSCASGGGRNDIESMRRGFPILRSDADRTSTALRLSMTNSYCRWIPFHGAAIKETESELEGASGAGSTPYVNRASLLPIYNMWDAYTHNTELDYDLMRRNFNEWKSVRHLLTRDFYPLTPWRSEHDRYGWASFAYDAPELGESLLLAFRMEDAENDTFTARLPFLEEDAAYEVTDDDSACKVTGDDSACKVTGDDAGNNKDPQTRMILSGRELSENGITIVLPEKKSSALYRIRRI